MEDKNRVRKPHRLEVEDRKRASFTGVTEVIAFEPSKVNLMTDYGQVVIKGAGLHVNRLSVDKGELDLDGRIDSLAYVEGKPVKKKDSLVERLLR